MRRSLSLPLLSALMVLAGCTEVDSTNLKTSGINAYLWATADGTGNTEARVELEVAGSTLTFVTLKDGDSITATAGGQTKTLGESDLLGVVEYGAVFSGLDAPGTSYAFALHRANDTSATNNSVTIPAPFSITAPTNTPTYSRANDAITVTYDNAGTGDVMSYSLDGSCIDKVDLQVTGDSGSFVIPKASIPKLPNASVDTCPVRLTVRRSHAGTLDSAFAGGSAFGVQARSVQFNSTP